MFRVATKRAFALLCPMFAGRAAHESIGVDSCFCLFSFHWYNIAHLAAIVKDFLIPVADVVSVVVIVIT